MKKIVLSFIVFNALFSNNNIWKAHSAHTLKQGRVEIGLFQPLRYGYNQFTEFSVHPGWFFLIPNFEIKESRIDFYKFKTASSYKVIYPTPLLNILAKEGIGGVIAPQHEMPSMFIFSGSLTGSRDLGGVEISLNAGLDLGLVFGELNPTSTLDLPLVYHRLGVLYNGWGIHSGVDFQKDVKENFDILLDFDILALPGYKGVFSFENKMLLSWNKSEKFKLMAGYKFVAGEYPYGSDARILPYIPVLETWVPIIELQWARNLK